MPGPGVTVTPYSTDGSPEIAGDRTDLILARHYGRLHVFHRDPEDHGALESGTPNGRDVRDTLAGLLACWPEAQARPDHR